MKSIILSLLLLATSLTAQHAQYMYAGELRFITASASPVGLAQAWAMNIDSATFPSTNIVVAGNDPVLVVHESTYNSVNSLQVDGTPYTAVALTNWYGSGGTAAVYVVTGLTAGTKTVTVGTASEGGTTIYLFTNANSVQTLNSSQYSIGSPGDNGITNTLTVAKDSIMITTVTHQSQYANLNSYNASGFLTNNMYRGGNWSYSSVCITTNLSAGSYSSGFYFSSAAINPYSCIAIELKSK